MTFGENVSAAAGWLAEGSAEREDPRAAAGVPFEGAPVDASETLAALRELYSLGLAQDDVEEIVARRVDELRAEMKKELDALRAEMKERDALAYEDAPLVD